MQRPQNINTKIKRKSSDSSRSSGRTIGEDTNTRRSKYFWEVKKCLDIRKALPSSLPLWLITEFNVFGGADIWVKRNYYWQKKCRDEREKINYGCEYMNKKIDEIKKRKGMLT